MEELQPADDKPEYKFLDGGMKPGDRVRLLNPRAVQHGEQMYIAMRDRCARVEADIATLQQERNTLQERVERLEKALQRIKSGVRLMVPEPQQSAFVEICDAALSDRTGEPTK